MQHETVIVLDFGGQYNQLIARRVRENNVYCEIYSYKTDLSVIKAKNPKGIIFTGGPNSVYLEDSPTIDPEIFNWGIPVLGICYGSQLMLHHLLDEPQRLHRAGSPRLQDHRTHRELPCGCCRERREGSVRCSVPPGSAPHR